MISTESQRYSQTKKAASKTTNFTTRAVKLRLFGLVCGVMLVLVLMFEAKKPENWAWMGFTEFEPIIDTRYLNNLYENDGQAANQSDVPPKSSLRASLEEQATVDSDAVLESDAKKLPVSTKPRKEFDKAEKTFWDSVYSKLNYRQRMLLMEGLYRARRGEMLDKEKTSEWIRMIEEFEVASDIYQADILKYLNSLPETDPQRGSLSNILFEFQNRSAEFLTIFKKITDEKKQNETSIAENQKNSGETAYDRSLKTLQSVIDQTAFGFVQDNALQSFSDDQPAMFRLIDMIQSGKYQLDIDSAGPSEPVMFAQLYKETERLRGKKVFFKGHIRGAYVTKPAKNYLGIDTLYVFWVQIAGARDPVAVYSLTAPKDFVIPLKPLDAEPIEIREPVSITGVLFQKMVYAAGDGNRIAPVVFTTVPNWQPVVEKSDSEKELPGLTYLVATFLGVGGIIAVGTWFFISFNGRRHQKKIDSLKKKYQLESFDDSADSTNQ